MAWRGRWRSSTLHFAALVFVLQIGSSALILLAVHQRTASELGRIAQTDAAELRMDLKADFDADGATALAELIHNRSADPGNEQAVILLVDAMGKPLAGNIAALPPTLPADGSWHHLALYRLNSDQPERMIASVTRLPDGSRLLTGHVVEDSLQLRAVVEELMLGVLLLSLPLALLGAWLVARMISGRVDAISRTVDGVAAGDLSRRTILDGSGDAFERLAAGINAMLDRIESLVTELRIVTDGLAHDLRSPLMRMRVATERAVAGAADENMLKALRAISTETETLLAMLTTALQISRVEAGIGRDRFTPFDATGFLQDLAELYAPLAEEHGFHIEVQAATMQPITAHRELLGQAIANLVDNALKYARPGPITLAATQDGDGVILRVKDSGPGIAAAQQEAALRRFGRLDPSRHTSGAGLGLTLAAAVAHLHGGTLDLKNSDIGFEVSLRLPASI